MDWVESARASGGMPSQTLWSRHLRDFTADRPVTVSDHIKIAWLFSYLTILPLIRAREINTPMQVFLSPHSIKKLILNGEPPENMAPSPNDSWPAMLHEIHETMQYSESLALILSCLKVKAMIEVAKDDDDLLQKLQDFVKTLESKAPFSRVPLPPIDYTEVYKFAEQQFADGGLKHIPSWQTATVGTRNDWRQRMEHGLAILRQRFEHAVNAHPALKMPPDPTLIGAMGSEEIRQKLESLDRVKLHLPSADFGTALFSEADIMDTCFDVKAIEEQATILRTELVECTKKLGNQRFRVGDLPRAQKLWETTVLAGSNDPASQINLAALYLRKPKTRETIKAALYTALAGLSMIAQVPPSDIIDCNDLKDSKERHDARMKRNAKWMVPAPASPFERLMESHNGNTPPSPSRNQTPNAGETTLFKATLPFKATTASLDSLECKAWVRSARAHVALAGLMRSGNRPNNRPNQNSEREGDRAVLLKTARQAYQLALEALPESLEIRLELEKLELEIDDSNPIHRDANADFVQAMLLHGPPPPTGSRI